MISAPLLLLLLLQDAVYAPQQLHTLLSQSDYVLISTPHTPETDKLIDAAAIAALKPDAVVVNVGRGKCVDEEALIKGMMWISTRQSSSV